MISCLTGQERGSACVFVQEGTNEGFKDFRKKGSLDNCCFMRMPFICHNDRRIVFRYD